MYEDGTEKIGNFSFPEKPPENSRFEAQDSRNERGRENKMEEKFSWYYNIHASDDVQAHKVAVTAVAGNKIT